MTKNHRGTKKKKKPIPIKLTDKCKDCKRELKKGNQHHWRCHDCWVKFQEKKGNFALIKGI